MLSGRRLSQHFIAGPLSESLIYLGDQVPSYSGKVKVAPYTIVRKGVPGREDTYAEPSACEVG